MDNRETLERLKMLNSLLEDFLDRMDMDAVDDEDEVDDEDVEVKDGEDVECKDGECKRMERKRKQADANCLMER